MGKRMTDGADPKKAKNARAVRARRRLASTVGLLAVLANIACDLSKKPLGTCVTDPEQCRSGLILEEQGPGMALGGTCTKRCRADSDCERMRCLNTQCAPRDEAGAGERCTHAWDCASGVCRLPSGGQSESANRVCGP